MSSGDADGPDSLIAIRGPKGRTTRHVQIELRRTALTYSLCGLGTVVRDRDRESRRSQRAALVRREILELALYTFKYVPTSSSVVAFMPPPAGTKPHVRVYLQKSDLTTS